MDPCPKHGTHMNTCHECATEHLLDEIERLHEIILENDREWYSKLEAADAEIERLWEKVANLESINASMAETERLKKECEAILTSYAEFVESEMVGVGHPPLPPDQWEGFKDSLRNEALREEE